MATITFPAPKTSLTTSNFLPSFPGPPPTLYITAETDTEADFDAATVSAWRGESFKTIYLPFQTGGVPFFKQLDELGKDLGPSAKFGIIAFGDAASAVLEWALTHRPSAVATGRISVVVAYYPGAIPASTHPTPGLRILVHLTSGEVDVTRRTEMIGLRGKKRSVTRRVGTGEGMSGALKGQLSYPSYSYDGVEAGFAEKDLDEYDARAERIAWSRSLGCVRSAFGVEVDLERVWDEHIDYADKALETMVPHPYVNHVPTLTGGMGARALRRFYAEYFIPCNPPSLKMTLVSRTVGADKVIDELILAFDHTVEIPWMLPGIPPTYKHVEVALVSVVSIRGGKLSREHIYWDQACVLKQIGALDPEKIEGRMKELGVERLPVAGVESARKVLNEKSEKSNGMIDDW